MHCDCVLSCSVCEYHLERPLKFVISQLNVKFELQVPDGVLFSVACLRNASVSRSRSLGLSGVIFDRLLPVPILCVARCDAVPTNSVLERSEVSIALSSPSSVDDHDWTESTQAGVCDLVDWQRS